MSGAMADTTVTHTIFFIAAVMVAASLAGVFISLSQDMAVELNERREWMEERSNSDFLIMNDPALMPYSDGNLTIYLKNLSSRIMPTNLDVFIDGALVTSYTVQDGQGSAGWSPSEVIALKIRAPMSAGDHHLKVALSNGVFEELRFRI